MLSSTVQNVHLILGFMSPCLSNFNVWGSFLAPLLILLLWRLYVFTLLPYWNPDEPSELPYWTPCEQVQVSVESMC